MSEKLSPGLGDWISVIGAALVAGVGGAMAWFNGVKHHLEARMGRTEETVNDHETKLAVVRTCQENTAERLQAIESATHETNNKLDRLIERFVDPN